MSQTAATLILVSFKFNLMKYVLTLLAVLSIASACFRLYHIFRRRGYELPHTQLAWSREQGTSKMREWHLMLKDVLEIWLQSDE